MAKKQHKTRKPRKQRMTLPLSVGRNMNAIRPELSAWSRSDRLWFATRSKRRFCLREPFPGEVEDLGMLSLEPADREPVRIFVAWHKRTGARVRFAIPVSRFADPANVPDDDRSILAAVEAATGEPFVLSEHVRSFSAMGGLA